MDGCETVSWSVSTLNRRISGVSNAELFNQSQRTDMLWSPEVPLAFLTSQYPSEQTHTHTH